MKIGLRLPQTGKDNANRENIVHLAKEADNASLDSLWVLERLVWPINPQNPYPGTKDGRYPDDGNTYLPPYDDPISKSKVHSKSPHDPRFLIY